VVGVVVCVVGRQEKRGRKKGVMRDKTKSLKKSLAVGCEFAVSEFDNDPKQHAARACWRRVAVIGLYVCSVCGCRAGWSSQKRRGGSRHAHKVCFLLLAS